MVFKVSQQDVGVGRNFSVMLVDVHAFCGGIEDLMERSKYVLVGVDVLEQFSIEFEDKGARGDIQDLFHRMAFTEQVEDVGNWISEQPFPAVLVECLELCVFDAHNAVDAVIQLRVGEPLKHASVDIMVLFVHLNQQAVVPDSEVLLFEELRVMATSRRIFEKHGWKVVFGKNYFFLL